MRAALAATLALAACGHHTMPIPPDRIPGDQETAGDVVEERLFNLHGTIDGPTPQGRVATHVLAIDPTPKIGDRLVVEPDPDGSFGFQLIAGHPYLIVFADDTATGSAAAIATLRIGDWVTMQSGPRGGILELGDITLLPGTATPSATEADLLNVLGQTPNLASFLEVTDDIAARYTNPDVDSDGELDILQNHRFGLDVYLQTGLEFGPSAPLRITDVIDAWPDLTELRASLGPSSLYATWNRDFDPTTYVDPTADQPTILAGGTFTATLADTAEPDEPTAYSGISYNEVTGWGPTWELHNDLELAGARGAPARLDWGLTSINTHLLFTEVSPREQAEYENDGMLLPLVRVDTSEGVVTGISWSWKRSTASGWSDATSEEVSLRLNTAVAAASVHLLGDRSLSFVVGGAAAGTIPVTDTHVTVTGVASDGLSALQAADLCRVSMSYDERIGNRVYLSGAQPVPNSGCL